MFDPYDKCHRERLKALDTIHTPDGTGKLNGRLSRQCDALYRQGEDRPFALMPHRDLQLGVVLDDGTTKEYLVETLLAFNDAAWLEAVQGHPQVLVSVDAKLVESFMGTIDQAWVQANNIQDQGDEQ